MKIWTALSVVLLGLLTGCTTLVPLTAELREKYDLDSEDLAQLQYFTSRQIVLDDTRATSAFNLQRHLIVDGVKQDTVGIVVNRLTPGVPTYVSPDGKFIKVRFENACVVNADTLGFGASQADWYRLAASELSEDIPMVEYDGIVYNATDESWQAYLLVDLDEIRDVKLKRRTLPGTVFCEYPHPAVVRPLVKFENPAPDPRP